MTMAEKTIYDCGIDATLDVIGGKWKPSVLYGLKDGTLRFGELRDYVEPHITPRVLTKQLRQLEADGLVIRKVYAQVPPKVEYTLTDMGKTLIPILDQLCEWGYEHMPERIRYTCEDCDE